MYSTSRTQSGAGLALSPIGELTDQFENSSLQSPTKVSTDSVQHVENNSIDAAATLQHIPSALNNSFNNEKQSFNDSVSGLATSSSEPPKSDVNTAIPPSNVEGSQGPTILSLSGSSGSGSSTNSSLASASSSSSSSSSSSATSVGSSSTPKPVLPSGGLAGSGLTRGLGSNVPAVKRVSMAFSGALSGAQHAGKAFRMPMKPVTANVFESIDVETLLDLMRQGFNNSFSGDSGENTILVCDIRTHTAYLQSHVMHSVNVSIPSALMRRPAFNLDRVLDALSSRDAKIFSKWKSKEWIVAIDDNSTGAAEGHAIVHFLRKLKVAGYGGHLAFLKGGIRAMEDAQSVWLTHGPDPDESDEDDEEEDDDNDSDNDDTVSNDEKKRFESTHNPEGSLNTEDDDQTSQVSFSGSDVSCPSIPRIDSSVSTSSSLNPSMSGLSLASNLSQMSLNNISGTDVTGNQSINIVPESASTKPAQDSSQNTKSESSSPAKPAKLTKSKKNLTLNTQGHLNATHLSATALGSGRKPKKLSLKGSPSFTMLARPQSWSNFAPLTVPAEQEQAPSYFSRIASSACIAQPDHLEMARSHRSRPPNSSGMQSSWYNSSQYRKPLLRGRCSQLLTMIRARGRVGESDVIVSALNDARDLQRTFDPNSVPDDLSHKLPEFLKKFLHLDKIAYQRSMLDEYITLENSELKRLEDVFTLAGDDKDGETPKAEKVPAVQLHVTSCTPSTPRGEVSSSHDDATPRAETASKIDPMTRIAEVESSSQVASATPEINVTQITTEGKQSQPLKTDARCAPLTNDSSTVPAFPDGLSMTPNSNVTANPTNGRSSNSPNYSISAGLEQGSLNRVRFIFPYEHSRVQLRTLSPQVNYIPQYDPDGFGYINASHISLPATHTPFIATQAPLDATRPHFWHMVAQERTCVVVMLTRLHENGRPKSIQYWDSNPTLAGDPWWVKVNEAVEDTAIEEDESSDVVRGVDADAVNDGSFFTPKTSRRIVKRSLTLTDDKKLMQPHHITQLQYRAWSDHETPSDSRDILRLIQLIHEAQDATMKINNMTSPPPIVVHCSAGVGRTGSLLAIYSLLERFNAGLPLDNASSNISPVLETCEALRNDRMTMVSNLKQYAFIYDCLLAGIANQSKINATSDANVDPDHGKGLNSNVDV